MSEKEKNENEEEMVFTFLEGDTIDLVPPSLDHVDLYTKWFNDHKVRHYARSVIPHTEEEIKKWFEPKDQRIGEFITFEIWHKEDKKPIGTAGFNHINWFNRSANIFQSIGEPEYWSKNIGTEVGKILVDYGFKELNFHKIFAGIFEPNTGSWKCAEKIGFIHEATLKEEIYVDGRYVDVKKYYLLKKDWFNNEGNK